MIDYINQKIISQDRLNSTLNLWRFFNKKIVFTNGCFDLLHYGHVHYLAEAKALGDILIVGLNTDNSISRIKGPDRPIKDEASRSLLLASLEFVDGVILFEEDNPLNLITQILPDILVKGADYQVNQIVGADVVLNNGGQIRTLEFKEGYSTSKMVDKIRSETNQN